MLNSCRIWAAQVSVICLIVAMGASAPAAAKSALTDKDGVLQYVPDDTPYVFATGAPLPDKVLDRLEPRFDEMLKAYQVFFREVFRSTIAKNRTNVSADEIQRRSAVVDEIMQLFSIEGLRNAGFERNTDLVVYGNGVSPVIRIELGNADKFDAVLARMEAAAGASMKTATLDGVEYRHVGNEKARLIIGVFNGNAVFTIAPVSLDEKQLKVLVGLTPPKKSIARSGKLLDIVKEYNFSEHYVGYVDGLRIASTFLDKPAGLDAALLHGSEYDAATISDVCKNEIRELVGVAPRMVFGYGEVSVDAMHGLMIIEMRDDIAMGLSTLSALVPGLGIDPGGLASFGMSFNVPAMVSFIEARIDAIEKDPFECEHFAELQAGTAETRARLAQPLPPFVTGLRGFNIIVDSLGDYDMSSGQPPKDVDASVLLSMDDAHAMFMMGAMMSPDLAAVDLQPDGVPVPLALPWLQGMAGSAYAAMKETVLAVAVGTQARTRVSALLDSDTVEPPPVFSATMDAGKYYELVASSAMAQSDDEGEENPLPEPVRIALRDAMLKVGEMYDRMTIDVRFTDRGIEMESTVTLRN